MTELLGGIMLQVHASPLFFRKASFLTNEYLERRGRRQDGFDRYFVEEESLSLSYSQFLGFSRYLKGFEILKGLICRD